MSDDYNKDLEIDFHQLHINWRDHSANYMDWCEKWVNAVAKRDRAREGLDIVKAELDKELRSKSYTKKPTEAAINAMIATHENYIAASDLVIKANEEVNLYACAKAAFEHKKKALEGMTQLWINGYWSNPSIPAGIKDKIEQDTTNYQKEQLNKNERLKRKAIKK